METSVTSETFLKFCCKYIEDVYVKGVSDRTSQRPGLFISMTPTKKTSPSSPSQAHTQSHSVV